MENNTNENPIEPRNIFLKIAEVKKNINAIVKQKSAEIPTKSGGKYSYKYADINAYLDELEPLFQEEKLLLLQPISVLEGKAYISTRIVNLEILTEMMEVALPLPSETDPQRLGAVITYYRRHLLVSLLALQAEDGDAAAKDKKEPQLSDLNSMANNRKAPAFKTFRYDVNKLLKGTEAEDAKLFIRSIPGVKFDEEKGLVSYPKQISRLAKFLIKE